MVNKNIINEQITKAIIIKCPATGKARKRGQGAVKEGVSFNDNPRNHTDEYSLNYPDGTRLVFDMYDTIKSITIDGTTYDYSADTCYDELEYQKQELLNSGEISIGDDDLPYVFDNDFEFLKSYSDTFASVYGWGINEALRKGESLGDLFPGVAHDHFVELANRLPIDHKNLICLRIQNNINHPNDKINRRIVKDKAHTSTSIGADMASLVVNFGSDSENGKPWKIYTVIKKDSGVTGLFLGSALKEERGYDWESEVNFPPNRKSERLLIDETNHIIIQQPVI